MNKKRKTPIKRATVDVEPKVKLTFRRTPNGRYELTDVILEGRKATYEDFKAKYFPNDLTSLLGRAKGKK